MKKPAGVLCFAFMLLLMLSACGKVPQPVEEPFETVTLKMNYALVISYAPIIIAEAEGFFADYGITIEKVTFNNSMEAIPLVVGGQLDIFAGANTSGILNVLGKEENIKVVADRGHISPDSCTFQAIVVRKDLFESGEVTEAKDLVGHSVITSTTGPAMYLLSQYLEQAGLTTDEVEISDIPNASFVDAFRNKAVDAIVVNELYLSRLLADGNASILVGIEDVVGSFQTSLLAFGKNLLVDNPEIGVRFMAAYLKGVKQYNEGKTERNLQILSEATGESVEFLKNACWIPINTDGSIDFSVIDRFQQWTLSTGELEAPITEEQFWDPSFLKAAKKMLEN